MNPQNASYFTPGPWQVGQRIRDNLPAVIADESVVCVLPGEHDGCTYNPCDARLIAAAPSLLAALFDMEHLLRRIQDTLSQHVDPEGDLRDPSEVLNALLNIADGRETLAKQRQALAAIRCAVGMAKATGEVTP